MQRHLEEEKKKKRKKLNHVTKLSKWKGKKKKGEQFLFGNRDQGKYTEQSLCRAHTLRKFDYAHHPTLLRMIHTQ